MRINCTARARLALAIASVVVPGLGDRVLGAAFSTPGVPVYTAVASGMDNNTISLGLNSTSNVLPLIDLDPAILAGYVTSSLDSTRELYNYNVLTNTASVIYVSDTSHKLSTSTPSLAIVTSNGITVGMQSRIDPVSGTGSEGTDVFFSNNGAAPVIVPVPTTVLGGGAVYTYNDSGNDNTPIETLSVSLGTTSSTSFGNNGANANGVIAGQITRYGGPGTTAVSSGSASPSTTFGNDGFYYDPTTKATTAIGLTGGVYDSTNPNYAPSSLIIHGVTVTGTAGSAGATGFSSRTDPSNNAQLGRDAWYYTPNTGTNAIGLVGGNYSTVQSDGRSLQVGTTLRTNSLGQVAGWNAVVPNSNIGGASGEDFWLYTPPTGPGATPGTATSYGTTSAGTYVRLGLTATPSGTTLGNIRPSDSMRFGNVSFLTNAGTAAGVSNRYDSSSASQGQAAWYFDGTNAPIDISPTDSIHAAVSGGTNSSTNAITAINSTSGLVAATVTRISATTGGTALGQDAYVYDTVAKKDFYVDTGDEGTSGYEFSYIGVISDTGVAVGYYNTYVGTSSTVTGSVVFDWSEGTGLQTLQTYTGSTASGSLSAYVDSFHFDANGNLYAPNTYGTGATSVIEYAAVPEPASATLLAVASLGLLRRRRLA
jgi:hypothetical protein